MRDPNGFMILRMSEKPVTNRKAKFFKKIY